MLEEALQSFKKSQSLVITERVREEYDVGERPEKDTKRLDATFARAPLVKVEDELLPFFHFDSTSGEISVMSFAMQHPGTICVIDEEYARRICRLFDLEVTGSIGIIKRILLSGGVDRTQIHAIRIRLRNSHFYITEKLIAELK